MIARIVEKGLLGDSSASEYFFHVKVYQYLTLKSQ